MVNRFEEINVDDLTARDLWEESEGYAKNEAGTQQAYRILVENSPEAAEALYYPILAAWGLHGAQMLPGRMYQM